jgi:hypothetical protein
VCEREQSCPAGESLSRRWREREKKERKKGNPEKYDYFLCEATEKMSSLLIVLPCVKDQKEEKIPTPFFRFFFFFFFKLKINFVLKFGEGGNHARP